MKPYFAFALFAFCFGGCPRVKAPTDSGVHPLPMNGPEFERMICWSAEKREWYSKPEFCRDVIEKLAK